MKHRFLLLLCSFLTYILISALLASPALSNSEPQITAAFSGDIYLGGALEPLILKDSTYPFIFLREFCNQNDLFFGNLEGSLSQKGEVYVEKAFCFRSNPKVVKCLKEGGINIVSLANNHIMDYGPEALAETIAVLDENGIQHAGAGTNLVQARKPALIEKNGLKVALLAYNCTYPLEFTAGANKPGTARGIDRHIIEDVKKARKIADLVFVSFHWSSELLKTRKPYQSYFAKLCIDSGAHLVIGHHPHVIQGVEVYKHGLIVYSLGNFIFASRSKRVQDAFLLQVELGKSGLKTASFYPININNYLVNFQPQPLSGEESQRVLHELQALSEPFGTVIEIVDDKGFINFEVPPSIDSEHK